MAGGLHVHSEIGELRRVMLHRPAGELLNLSPDTLGPLLFDDIPFLRVAQEEHDAFAGMLRQEGVEVVYLVCSLPMTDAQPEAVAAWVRGHWGIENRLHWIRDVVFDEDRHQLSTRNGPEIMAALRNLAISLIRLFLGPGVSFASTARSLSRRPKRAIKLITQPTT